MQWPSTTTSQVPDCHLCVSSVVTLTTPGSARGLRYQNPVLPTAMPSAFQTTRVTVMNAPTKPLVGPGLGKGTGRIPRLRSERNYTQPSARQTAPPQGTTGYYRAARSAGWRRG